MLMPISNAPREYSWGSETLIPELEGRTPTGRPEAEIWYGDHPGCPSLLADGSGRTLAHARAGQAPLPYLMKILAAGMSLSIQAHPSKAEAERGFAREEAAGIARDAAERTYRDDNHKPEIIVAVSDVFRALVGLRPLAATRRLIAALGEAEEVRALAARLDGRDEPALLRGAVQWALDGDSDATVAAITAALAVASSEEFAAELAVLRRIAGAFPGDRGIIVALLMNLVELRRGEALFAPAGVLHAYQDGLGVELMAASDNVLRGGLTPKHIDVAELMAIVDTTPGPVPVLDPRTVADGVEVFDPGIPDFVLTHVTAKEAPVRVPLGGPAVALVTAGRVSVAGADAEPVALGPGQAVYLTADEDEIVLAGPGEIFLAEPGV